MVEILLDIGALGGSYISLALWRGLKNLLRRYIDTSSAGSLEAANPSYSDTAPMRSLGSAVVSVLLESDRRVRNVVVYASYKTYPTVSFSEQIILDKSAAKFAPDKDFRPVP